MGTSSESNWEAIVINNYSEDNGSEYGSRNQINCEDSFNVLLLVAPSHLGLD